MANAPVFTADVEGPSTEKRRSGWQTCLIGCLIVFVILIVIAVLVGFWISRNWRDLSAAGATAVVRQMMLESNLPPEEQQEIMVQVDRVATAFREKSISGEQVAVLMQKLVEPSLVSVFIATEIERKYLPDSGLSDEEKVAANNALLRFMRGAIDKKIQGAGFEAAMGQIAVRDPNGVWQLRKQITDEQLRAFFAEAKKQADEAGIPEQPTDIDPSEEIKKIVDEALAAPAA